MHFSSATVIVAGLAAQQAAATGWSVGADKYSCPSNTNNQCSQPQQGGYNWSGLQPGAFSSYGSNSFSGFTCGNSFGKRDALTKRTFQSKCISGELHKTPSISCTDHDSMSIDTYQVSTSYDTDVECHYGMPDGSTCKETHSCTSGGNIIKNNQCGGATSVTFKPKKGDSGHKNGEACSIGIHSIGFNCGSASSTVPAYGASTSSVAVATSSSVAAAATTSSAVISSSSIESVSSSLSSYFQPSSSSSEASPVTSSLSSYSAPAYSSYANVSSSIASATPSSSVYSPVTASSSSSTPGSAYGFASTMSSLSQSSSASASASTSAVPSAGSSSVVSPVSNSTSPAVYSATSASASATSSNAAPSPNCPGLLPRCLNTWMWETGCKDNSDYSCYCKDANYISHVMGCIESWSGDDSETQGAASYLQGICAPYVPQNPAIITACPSGVQPTASPATSYPASSSSEASPVESSSSEVAPVSSSPLSSSTLLITTTSLSTSTVYSTAVSTITSCAAGGSDCAPESQSTAYVTKTIAISTTICPVTATQTATAPVSSSAAPAESSSAAPAASSSEASPVQSSESAQAPPAYSTAPVASSSEASPVETSSVSAQAPPAYGSPAVSSSEASPAQTSPAISTTDSYGAPPAYAPPATGSSAAAAITTAPATSGSPASPVTTITYSSSTLVPATYSTGESMGFTIPASSTYATIDTTITVPQVQFTTSTITLAGSTSTISVGLAAGSPSAAPAYPTNTAGPIAGAAAPSGYGAAGTTFHSTFAPSATSSPIAPYSGAASRTSVAGLTIGAVVAAFFML